MDPEKPPLLIREDDPIEFTQPNGKTRTIGFHVDDMTTGKHAFLRYTTRFWIHNSHALTCDLLAEYREEYGDPELMYVIDKDTKELFRYRVRDFVRGRTIEDNRQTQFALNADENIGCWEKGWQYVVTEDEADTDD